MTTSTQYRVMYQGRECHTFGTDKAEAERFIAGGIRTGHDPEDYGIAHRTVTHSEWAPTTYDPAAAAAEAADPKPRVQDGKLLKPLYNSRGHFMGQQVLGEGFECPEHGPQARTGDVLACGHIVLPTAAL